MENILKNIILKKTNFVHKIYIFCMIFRGIKNILKFIIFQFLLKFIKTNENIINMYVKIHVLFFCKNRRS